MIVNVTFDPSYSFDETQNATLQIFSNACAQDAATMESHVFVTGAATNGFTPTPVLACDNPVDSISVKNGLPSNVSENLWYKIVSADWVNTTSPNHFLIKISD